MRKNFNERRFILGLIFAERLEVHHPRYERGQCYKSLKATVKVSRRKKQESRNRRRIFESKATTKILTVKGMIKRSLSRIEMLEVITRFKG